MNAFLCYQQTVERGYLKKYFGIEIVCNKLINNIIVMKLVAMTLPYEVYNESHYINKLFELGLDVLHFRKEKFTTKEVEKVLKGINPKFYSKIILHNHFRLLSKFDLGGIHVGYKKSQNFVKSNFYKLLKKNYNLSVSTTVNKIDSKLNKNSLIDFYLFGPLFQKLSEETIIKKYNLFELKANIQGIDKDFYALKCYSLKNIFQAKASGFQSIVLEDFIWKSGDFLNAFHTIKNNIEKIEHLENIAI